jgi:starch synthase
LPHIVYLTTEAVPLAKTGGLADVCGSLPGHVRGSRYETTLMMPAFSQVYQSGCEIETTDWSFAIQMGDDLVGARLLRTQLPGLDHFSPDRMGDGVPVLMIDQPRYFARDGLYGPPGGAYGDNAERFIFFCRAALMALEQIGKPVDILHCNDWQTALIPALIRSDPKAMQFFKNTKTILTIHNLAYQGHFDSQPFPLTDLSWDDFTPDKFEYYGGFNFLKTGLLTADAITTVSPTYAEEICTPEFGCGLDSILRSRQSVLTGIINGIDTAIWNTRTDPFLAARYGPDDYAIGKAIGKTAVQRELGLVENPDIPVIGLVGRLAEQKGWDLILPVISDHVTQNRPVQWAILGSGSPDYQRELERLAADYPDRLGLRIGFSEALAHRIEAASDLFLMPSHYEPCGLNQLYSLAYGAVPIVTRTGGLADTVVDFQESTTGTATGFFLTERTPKGLSEAIGRALHTRYHDRSDWQKMVVRGMTQDWSWKQSALRYQELYDELLAINLTGTAKSGR